MSHIDTEAALDEGLAEMPADLIALRDEKLLLDDEIEKLTARKKEITDEFGDRLQAEGLQGYLLYGNVHARVSQVETSRVDGKKLKAELPHIFTKYMKVTKSRRVVVN